MSKLLRKYLLTRANVLGHPRSFLVVGFNIYKLFVNFFRREINIWRQNHDFYDFNTFLLYHGAQHGHHKNTVF